MTSTLYDTNNSSFKNFTFSIQHSHDAYMNLSCLQFRFEIAFLLTFLGGKDEKSCGQFREKWLPAIFYPKWPYRDIKPKAGHRVANSRCGLDLFIHLNKVLKRVNLRACHQRFLHIPINFSVHFETKSPYNAMDGPGGLSLIRQTSLLYMLLNFKEVERNR